ncbi:EbsA family protein [Vagococcus sp.]|uniref:EbsA family protein n=1 Tax=Vagococcus sp. TaxID=1933889 RepID=UPI003F9C4AE2
MNSSKIHVFRYQPDLTGSVIYWSWTCILFFLGIIGLLEERGTITPFIVITFLLFVFFSYLGTKRRMILTNEQLKVSAILKKNRYLIELSTINKILIGTHGVTIYTNKKDYSYIMFPPSKRAFVESLKQESNFKGKLLGKE